MSFISPIESSELNINMGFDNFAFYDEYDTHKYEVTKRTALNEK